MSSLEARYRRLLACYPREHRARHEEEMIGVMLAGAEPGRRYPDPRDALDLIMGGLRIRLQRSLGPEAASHWRDALNVAAIVAPLSLLVLEVGAWGMALWVADALPLFLTLVPLAFVLPQALIIGLALRGMRWPAAACAWIWAAAGPAINLQMSLDTVIYLGPGSFSSNFLFSPFGLAFHALPGLIVALLLTLAPHPAGGAALIGHRRLLRWAVVAILTLNASAALTHLFPPSGLIDRSVTLTLVAMACGAGSRTTVGRRAVSLMVPLLAVIYGGTPPDGPGGTDWPLLTVQALLVVTVFTVARRGFRPYGTGTVSSPERLV
ncbi:hypothetical protein ACFV0L_08580 [Streptosporangium canum]|uniref:hypothetical protein n=1 Tax=Streptosporangium canum TaxID=324952 RepID=UPI0036B434C6